MSESKPSARKRQSPQLSDAAVQAEPAATILSLRGQVKEAVVSLLAREQMSCRITQDGIVNLIHELSHYTEEGRELFPEVFLFDNLEAALATLPAHERVLIGEGPKSPDTMGRALKKCAPLARLGWSVFIERRKTTFAYGLFRYGVTMLSLGAAEVLVEKGLPEIPVLMLRQIGRNVIELRGVSQNSLLVYFGARRDGEASIAPVLSRFVSAIVRDVSTKHQEQTATFYRRVMTVVTQAGHGTLAAVMSSKRRALPKQFSVDGIALRAPISVPLRISELLANSDCQSNTQLLAYNALITGMLLSDGITVFGSDGTVRAYNVFVKHPPHRPGEAASGGARHRTFEVLSSMARRGAIIGALMESQDGRVQFCGGNSDEH